MGCMRGTPPPSPHPCGSDVFSLDETSLLSLNRRCNGNVWIIVCGLYLSASLRDGIFEGFCEEHLGSLLCCNVLTEAQWWYACGMWVSGRVWLDVFESVSFSFTFHKQKHKLSTVSHPAFFYLPHCLRGSAAPTFQTGVIRHKMNWQQLLLVRSVSPFGLRETSSKLVGEINQHLAWSSQAF